ncbi:PHP domain-containing protein, partial [Buchananella hordeovulneris]|uniref:PHP domain-containing protein n=1 Tax=Buchananella hordeovulneris TaxID=52770 RepID=UPI001C9E3281
MFESYAELHAHSSYSFLDGAAHPATLLRRATELELTALALTDTTGLPGVVALAQAAREQQADGGPVPATIFGTELTLRDLAAPAGVHRFPPPRPAGPPD